MLMDYKLSRANEMLLGVALPFLLLICVEIFAKSRGLISPEYMNLQKVKAKRKEAIKQIDEEEEIALHNQNVFGLKMIAFSLSFIAVLLYVLCFFFADRSPLVGGIATVILMTALIPWRAAKKVSPMK